MVSSAWEITEHEKVDEGANNVLHKEKRDAEIPLSSEKINK